MDSSDDENMMPVERRTPSPPPRPVEALSTKKVSLRFECPDNFEEVPSVEESKLTLEDIAGKKELWLIRVPNDFDSSSMNGVELNLKNRSQFSCGEKTYQAVSKKHKKNQMKGSTDVLLPNEHGVLCSGPQFKGHVTVMEVPKVPSIKIPVSPPSTKLKLPSGMRQRYQPFGCDSPKKTREAENTDISSSPSKKKKKKKKQKKAHDHVDVKEEKFSSKSEEETDSSFTNVSHSTPTEDEDVKPFAVKRMATDLFYPGAENVKRKKKKAKKDKR